MLPGFCISLFRPHRHPGIPAAAHPARAHRAFLSRRARTVSDHSANPGEAHPRISGMGRRLCAQPQDPGHEGRKRREQGGLCPPAMCVGTYLPFQTTYYLNGHNFMDIELRRQGVAFRKDDNAFLATADPKALQAAADQLSASILEKRLNYWSWLLAPKFSEKDRKAVNLRRDYSINQIEYCRNFIFQRNFPIHKIFERSCEMGLFRLAADKVAHIFGVRVTKRLRGKL